MMEESNGIVNTNFLLLTWHGIHKMQPRHMKNVVNSALVHSLSLFGQLYILVVFIIKCHIYNAERKRSNKKIAYEQNQPTPKLSLS